MESTLPLDQMYEMQKALDARIIKEKGLEGQDLLPNTVLALQVEIAELANEWRGFKHWSNRQKPKMFPLEKCSYCGEEVSYTRPTPFMADAGADMCEHCWESTRVEYAAAHDEHIGEFKDYPHFPKKQPQKLLEEYVDCLHFFLSIARQLNLPADDLYIPDDVAELKTVVLFTEILHNVGMIIGGEFLVGGYERFKDEQRHFFRGALACFYSLGEQRLGFTFEQIAEAYTAKNKVNHDRQSNGY
ncbi:dimeric dUTPase (all-alpha-NTP-PPase superfamily) [Paenibacillus sp. PastF-3]|uniref:dUTP diphosphatase n=1 Tax=Paenibacillus sp. PastF-3 TaxID=2940626 RepID=UPI002472EC21|nr:dUTP diphosphatase [Paenibacillus sp. PastF-3]MDH6373567.1 dimeric dUTPase (all-alpha-NTP-PPase superfamily) [Paenibacillus sp. PastF-3]